MQEKQQIYESVMIGSKQYGSRKKIVSNPIVLEKLFQGLYQHIKEIILQWSKILDHQAALFNCENYCE